MLVKGGPGSGKTTVAIIKAADLAQKQLKPEQRILFLSFARATVSRVLQAIQYEQKIPAALQQKIEVDTYHSFFWRILKSHGYLIGLPRYVAIMTPPQASIALSDIRSQYGRKATKEQKLERSMRETAERERLAKIEGRICFDLFALYAGQILAESERVRALVSNRYPVIVLDEFQDTKPANAVWPSCTAWQHRALHGPGRARPRAPHPEPTPRSGRQSDAESPASESRAGQF